LVEPLERDFDMKNQTVAENDTDLTASAKLPASARVVVIGGGAVGCSVLYHLAEMGWT
jgi:pyruvate/2-oxoglutarate dehydrogenase complex dihydrolipoamide dehydrogenase (E3) component